jgi:hypothetical protein
MKLKNVLFLLIGLTVVSCQERKVEKPEELIDEETMIAIFYDLSVLEAIKTNNPIALEQHQINPYTYIYKKYNIDSLQFVENNLYYATDLKAYKKMYEKVELQLIEHKALADSAVAKAKKSTSKEKIGVDTTLNQQKSKVFKKKRSNTEN